jgi:hypothetical protein
MDILSSVVSCINEALRKFRMQGHNIKDLKGELHLLGAFVISPFFFHMVETDHPSIVF